MVIIKALSTGEKPRTDSSNPIDAIKTPPITPGAATAEIPCKRMKLTKSAKLIFIPLRYITATDVVISLIVDPHIWTVEQRGTVKLAISLVAPFFMVHSRVTGITAELEQIEKPVRYAGIMFPYTFKRIFLSYQSGYDILDNEIADRQDDTGCNDFDACSHDS